jgi:asparagine synthase (glutamine-hydrolysing)
VCGIVGFSGPREADANRVLGDMLTCISYRGPDDQGLWSSDDVALGHVRLSVIDLSERGRQPFSTSDGQGVITYNGEVYNFRDLRAELEQCGIVFRSATDTEVVLYALHYWGPERAILRLNGTFAFAYYDLRDRSLWLARDRLGIKPLYIARSGGTFAFASEQKSLFAHPRISRTLDVHAIIDLLLYERFEGAMTPYQGVESVAPGTLLRLQAGREVATTYFDVLRDIDPGRILAAASTEFVAHFKQFEQLFVESVMMHLASDAPLTTMCSGGLDSSLITAVVKSVKPDVVSYVADVEGMNQREVNRARTVCNALGVELRIVNVDTENFYRMLPTAILANDQPLFFSQDVATMLVAEAINADGFKVVLTGDGADEVFGGYDWHAQAYETWRRRRIRARWIADNPLTRKLGRFIPGLRPVNLRAFERDPFGPSQGDGSNAVNPLNVLLVDGARRHLRETRIFQKLESLPHHEERAFLAKSFEDLHVHMRERLGTVDKMTMRYSVEARVPFLENCLVDFGLHLPVSAKYHKGTTKRIVKHLSEQRLPIEVVHLPKIGFRVDPSMWEGTAGFLRDGYVADLLKWRADDQDEILALLRRHPYFQFRLIATEVWLRMWLGGESATKLSSALLQTKIRA